MGSRRTGGAERVACEQARFFTERGADVSLLVGDYDPKVARDYGVPEEVTIVETDGSLLGDVRTVRELVREDAVDIFFTHSFKKRVYLATRPFGNHTPYVPHVHGTVLWFVDSENRLPHRNDPGYRDLISEVPGHGSLYERFDPTITERASSHVNEWLEGRALRSAPLVTTGSQQVSRELRTLYDVGSMVVRPGVDGEWLRRYDDVEERELSPHEHTILSVSRLDPRKRVDLLIKATDDLRAAGHDVGLVVAGTGEERESLELLASKWGVESAVTFEGFVSEEDLPSFYKSADAFACPGWMSYGITPLEAYAMHTSLGVSTDAFVNEVLGDSPGVEVIEPTVDAWVERLPRLFEFDPSDLDPSVVPTWDDFCERMYEIAEELTEHSA